MFAITCIRMISGLSNCYWITNYGAHSQVGIFLPSSVFLNCLCVCLCLWGSMSFLSSVLACLLWFMLGSHIAKTSGVQLLRHFQKILSKKTAWFSGSESLSFPSFMMFPEAQVQELDSKCINEAGQLMSTCSLSFDQLQLSVMIQQRIIPKMGSCIPTTWSRASQGCDLNLSRNFDIRGVKTLKKNLYCIKT